MLRNSVYRVLGQDGNIVHLEHRDNGTKRDAHVSQIARFYESTSPQPTVQDTVTTEKERSKAWQDAKVGDMVAFWTRGEPAGHIRLGEVLENDEEGRQLAVWYYIHGGSDAHKFNPARPLSKTIATPEWYNSRNQAVLRPKDTSKLEKRVAVVTEDEVELVATNFQLVRGKVPQATLDAVDDWLRKMSALDKSALSSLNGKGDDDSESRQLWVLEQHPSQLEEIQWDRFGYADMTSWKRHKLFRRDDDGQPPHEAVLRSLEAPRARKAKERVTARGFAQAEESGVLGAASSAALFLLLLAAQPKHVESLG